VISGTSSIELDVREPNQKQTKNSHAWGVTPAIKKFKKIGKQNFKDLTLQKDLGDCPS
jgi:hypothetical protein